MLRMDPTVASDTSDCCDNQSRSIFIAQSGSSMRQTNTMSSKGSDDLAIKLVRSRKRIVTVGRSPYTTPTTGTPLDEPTSPAERPPPEVPPRKLWNSPFVPSKASTWPDDKSKEYWIGPFDMDRSHYAKKAREADWKEDEGICNIRKLAESLYDMSDFVEARYAWAQIADHYISEYQHVSRWASGIDFKAAWDRQLALNHISQASIGGMLNTSFAQNPDLCEAIKADETKRPISHVKPHPVFRAVVDYDEKLSNTRALYNTRVMLDYASSVAYGKDHAWMRTVYKRALDAAGQSAGLDVCEIIKLRQGLVDAIIESERQAYWDRMNDDLRKKYPTLSSEQREAYRIQSTLTWKDEVEELYLHIIADQQFLLGATSEATISSELELVKHYKFVADTENAKARARQVTALTKERLGADHDTTFRCIASLATLLLDTGFIEEAGLVVHDCFTKHPGIMSGSTDMLSLELREKFITRRGWKEMMVVRSTLETRLAPFHFAWVEYKLFTLCIGTITFVQSYPTDAQKEGAWGLAYQEPKRSGNSAQVDEEEDESAAIIRNHFRQSFAPPRSKTDAENFAFSASERDHEFLDLKVPYIGYQHFMTTSAFQAGMPYLEYVKAMEDPYIANTIYEEAMADTPIQIGEYLREWETRRKGFNADKDGSQPSRQEQQNPGPSRARRVESESNELEASHRLLSSLLRTSRIV